LLERQTSGTLPMDRRGAVSLMVCIFFPENIQYV